MPTNDVLPTAHPDEGCKAIPFISGPLGKRPFPKLSNSEADVEFEIGHVLFIDIVGYSRLLLGEQSERLRELNEVVRGTKQFRRAEAQGTLVRLPTGDGMALVFRSSPEAPAQCALEISQALKAHPAIQLRMGIHSGPVNEISDVNERANVAGAGINIAQRIMDCGDAGHILISRHVAEDLQHSGRWKPHLHQLGEYEMKHGVVVAVVNLFTDDLGNSALPSKFSRAKKGEAITDSPDQLRSAKSATRLRLMLIAASLIILTASVVIALRLSARSTRILPGAAGESAIPQKSIAVLPFENLSASQETAFFTDGVQDEILTDLAKVADLKVISRTSVMQYRNSATRNLRDIGRQFGVAHVLEGSVQRSANRIRVNAQLIDARTDAHLWAQTYDRDLADVFAIQTEIARTIADQLQAKLSPKEEAALETRPTENLAAYDAYLRATQVDRNRSTSIGSGGAESAKNEIALLEEAIRQDPSFVPAICLLAQTHLYLHWMNADQSVPHLEKAKEALERAARLQPNGGEVHETRALLYYWGSRNYVSALAELSLARRILPNEMRVLFITAMIERRQNNWMEATRHLEQAMTLDPCNLTLISELAGTYGVLLRYAEAAKILDKALAWKPNDFGLAFLRADVDMLWKADLHRWKELVNSDAIKTADPNDVITARVDLAVMERDYRAAEQLLAREGGTEYDDNGFFTPREWKEAIVAGGLGNQSRAIASLQAARQRVALAVRDHPSDAKAVMVLGQIDAALGHKEEAIQEGQHASELLPVSKDAINGYQLLARLVAIYAQLGEKDRAFELLGKGIRQPYSPSYGSLKLDQVWDPLRSDPRFDKLVASLAPRE